MSDDLDDTEGESLAVSTPSPTLLNKLFCEQVLVAKGYRFGIGSVHHHFSATLRSSTPCPSRLNHMETEFVEIKNTVSSLDAIVSTLCGKFDTL
ncbi:unnamed protein product [Arabidopsis thaliana]|uniref:Uncharacterized protein n=1 Tax=Arabidopsis thaliana TaxID=3702 RepID=A0A654EFC0_ARATH|nr:unnamed protein product [Arabidopsis thaliana]